VFVTIIPSTQAEHPPFSGVYRNLFNIKFTYTAQLEVYMNKNLVEFLLFHNTKNTQIFYCNMLVAIY